MMSDQHSTKLKRTLACIGVALILLGCCIGLLYISKVYDGILHVRFLDVGQADACLISLNGQHVIIDGGNSNNSRLIYSVLEQNHIRRLKAVINSHPDDDHIGGLPAALQKCKTNVVWSSSDSADSKRFKALEKYAERNGITVRVPYIGETLRISDAVITVLSAEKDLGSVNNDSLVVRLDYGDISFLFTGDIEAEAEEDLIKDGAHLSAEVLKVAHHGSNTSSTISFLESVSPQYAVISVGRDNSYGLPKGEVLDRLEKIGATIIRTDQLGSIEFTSDGKTYQYSSEKTFNPQKEFVFNEYKNVDRIYVDKFIGNINSHVFHLPTCKSLPSEKNRVYFDSREQAVKSNYSPCKNCKP